MTRGGSARRTLNPTRPTVHACEGCSTLPSHKVRRTQWIAIYRGREEAIAMRDSGQREKKVSQVLL